MTAAVTTTKGQVSHRFSRWIHSYPKRAITVATAAARTYPSPLGIPVSRFMAWPDSRASEVLKPM